MHIQISSAACPRDEAIFLKQDAQYCKNPKVPAQDLDCRGQDLKDDGSVWRAGSNRWTSDDEIAFSNWVVENVTEDFFEEYKIATNCADYVFALRAIFARIHYLPFVVRFNPGHVYGKGVSHNDRIWADTATIQNWSNWKENLKNDKRFRKFLKFMSHQSSTWDVTQNMYPIEIFNEDGTDLSSALHVGSAIFWGNHIGLVFSIDDQCRAPIVYRASYVPQKIRKVIDTPFSGGLFKQEDGNKHGVGYLNWNWDYTCNGQWFKTPDEKMPGFSKTNQYQTEEASIRTWIEKHMHRLIPDQKYFDRMVDFLTDYFQIRVGLVNEAISLWPKHLKDFQNPKSAMYENYSTPSRDKKSCDGLSETIIDTLGEESEVEIDALFYRLQRLEVTSFKKADTKSGMINLADLLLICQNHYPWSSAPSHSYGKRWASEKILSNRMSGKTYFLRSSATKQGYLRVDFQVVDEAHVWTWSDADGIFQVRKYHPDGILFNETIYRR